MAPARGEMDSGQLSSELSEAWGNPEPGWALAGLPQRRPRGTLREEPERFLAEVRHDLGLFKAHEVVLYDAPPGAGDGAGERTVAVLSRTTEPKANRLLEVKLGVHAPDGYRVQVFERLPLPVQMRIVRAGTIVYGEPERVVEYFLEVLARWREVVRVMRGVEDDPAVPRGTGANASGHMDMVPSRVIAVSQESGVM